MARRDPHKENATMNGGKRTPEQRRADILFATEFFVKGYEYRAITDMLNENIRERGLNYQLSHVTVYNDMQKETERWKKDNYGKIEDYIARDLRRLDKMESELWTAWEASKGGKRRVKVKGGNIAQNGATSGGLLDERVLESGTGDPTYLRLIMDVQRERARLLSYTGITRAPEPTKPTADVSNIPADKQKQIADMLQGIPKVDKSDNL